MKRGFVVAVILFFCFLSCPLRFLTAYDDNAQKRDFVQALVDEATELIKTKGEEALSIIRSKDGKFYTQDTYVFITSAETGADIVNPAFEEIEGVPAGDYPDSASDNFLAQQIIVGAVKDKDTAWVEYYWQKPGETAPSKKVSYLRKITVNGKERIIGAGFYPEDAEVSQE